MRRLALLLLTGLLAGCPSGSIDPPPGNPAPPPPADPPADPPDDPPPPPRDPGPGIALAVEEPAGVARISEPVTSGVPFAQGALQGTAALYLLDPSGTAVPAQFRVLSAWPDGSVRWLLVDFQADVGAGQSAVYALLTDGAVANPAPQSAVSYSTGSVDTGAARFTFDPQSFDLFSTVSVGGTAVVTSGQGAELVTGGGTTYSSRDASSTVTVREQGPMKLTLEVAGALGSSGLRYTCWLNFYAGRSMVRVLFRLQNHQAAGHPGNFWDLGSSGSEFFDEMRLRLTLAQGNGSTVTVLDRSGTLQSGARIYQDSSGGDNWDSENHVNGDSDVQTSFRGYRSFVNGTQVDSGNRPVGYLDVSGGTAGVAVSIRHFWQNFPNKLAVDERTLDVALWPADSAFDHELQGGEFKTHEVLFDFHTGGAGDGYQRARAFDEPLFARAPAQHFADSKALGDFVPYDPAAHARYELVNATAHAPDGAGRSAVSQREHIDEYGWRNFGDMMADHERDGNVTSWSVPISHYNNQYDGAYGGLLNYVRTGQRGFLDFGEAYARHVADIDVYHADSDPGPYEGGLFWHTPHDVNALTSSHRSWSKDHLTQYPGQPWLDGGGPDVDHLYARGVWTLYYLRGYYPGREAGLEMADFAVMQYQTKGAGSNRARGNAVMTLVAACRDSSASTYYDAIVGLIRQYGAQASWGNNKGPYPASVGEFLRLKTEMGETGDADYQTALAALLANSDGALGQDNYGAGVGLLRFTESLSYAYRYAPAGDPNRAAYKAKAGEVWESVLDGLWTGDGYPAAKVLSYILSYSHTWPHFDRGGE